MFLLMTEEEESAYMARVQDTIPTDDSSEQEENLSCHAMTGSAGVNAIKVQGWKGKHKLTILIDTGCTSCFISELLAYQLGCEVVDANPISIQIADGNIIRSDKLVPQFSWIMKGEEFSFFL